MQPLDRDHPLVSLSVPTRRTAAVRVSLALVVAGGTCAVTPLVMAASAAPSCPSGQMAATRIEYEGKYSPNSLADAMNLHALVPNEGYTRRTVLVADGYYKEMSEGTIAVVKDKPPGKPIPGIDNPKLYVRELPSRFIIIETPQQRLVFDERGDPDELGTKRNKSKVSAAEDSAIVGGMQTALAASADKTKIIGKATHAGIACDVRQFLMPGSSQCIARIRGQYVVLAEEMQVPTRGRSWMQAKAKTDVCVSAREFAAPAQVRFKSS